MFQNLVRLKFRVNQSNWHVLKALLLVAPNLKVLVLEKSDDDEKYNRLCCIGSPDGSGCLSLFTAFSFDGYEELEDEVEFVKYVPNEARLLNTMTIKMEAKHLKRSVLQRLSMQPVVLNQDPLVCIDVSSLAISLIPPSQFTLIIA
uniref:FBD domain-containing protein n=1 Tax=Quercus lobata TaxID=97700 RepID=A0A7N2R8P2_QUELO